MSFGNKNPFYEPEIDDEMFLTHPRAGSSGFMLPQHSSNVETTTPSSGITSPAEDRHRQIQLQKKEIENRTLESSGRSIALLYESEKVGVATGEELTRQKEKLLRTEERLDDINNTLKQSERHLNGIKSVFGGIKNYLFAKKSGLPPPDPQPAIKQSTSDGSIGLNKPQQYQPDNDRLDTLREENHPALRSRGLVEGENKASVDEILDGRLDEMAMGLNRLKGLALDLNEELDDHDDILNRLHDKASHADIKVGKQNKTMDKILK